ncbi:hypothetical protein AZI87_06800 [Bdellovibrio bacteriovorus]|uniref:Secreted protein n=1 Tax=Bdellovibrio bacteriovorus TaxID=959 RepID=A0A162GTN8_BDEBC|nr:hypothetical protein [Bdellovibrio bacteriovorus]KYG68929.1 hypothetical protein AZI87_06800 [Bdellovibrio bacteriovorus]
MSFLLSLILSVGIAHAADQASCPDIAERRDGTKIQQMLSGNGECFFSVTPDDAWKDLIYRDHLFTSEGMFMVFNSFGPGDESQTTGAREFYLFPRNTEAFSYEWKDDTRELIVTHVTGDKFVFESKKARLKSITRANVIVADYVEPSNRGGIEITNFQGIILDGGFKLGSPPTSNSNASSVFRDVNNTSCSVKNSELFKYTSDGDIYLKYNDKAMLTFIQKRCPKLKLP